MGERFCVIERHDALKEREIRGGCGEQNGEKEGGGEREPRQLGAPTDTHFCLSSFPLRAGSRQVTAGLHFWQTRGELLSHKAMHDSPMTLSRCNKAKAAWTFKQKKLTRYRSTAANFHEVVSKGWHTADGSGRGGELLLGCKTPAFSPFPENSSLKMTIWPNCRRRNDIVICTKWKTMPRAIFQSQNPNEVFYPFNQ